jgi:membrane fusion protein, multidrug efflux system
MKKGYCFLIILGLSFCWALPKAPPVTFSVFTVSSVTDQDEHQFAGTITTRLSPTLYAEKNGKVESLHKTTGQAVKQGDVITTIDEQTAKGSFIAAKHAFELSKTTFHKMKKLYHQSSISQLQFDQAKANYYQAYGQALIAESNLKKSKITAPCNGRLGVIQVKSGDLAEFGTTIVNIACQGTQWVDFYVPENQIHLVKNSDLSIKTQHLPKPTSVTLIGIDQTVNPKNRMVLIRARVNQPSQLLQGQFATVVTKLHSQKIVKIPLTALEIVQDQYYVYQVHPDKHIVRTEVSIGKMYKDEVQIIKGLEPGDQIIKAGWDLWKPGIEVNLV